MSDGVARRVALEILKLLDIVGGNMTDITVSVAVVLRSSSLALGHSGVRRRMLISVNTTLPI